MSRILIADVIFFICETTGIPKAQMTNPDGHRTYAVSRPRHLAVWLARRHTSGSWSAIAAKFGFANDKALSTTMARFAGRLADDPDFAADAAATDARFIAWAAGVADARALASTRAAFLPKPVSAQHETAP